VVCRHGSLLLLRLLLWRRLLLLLKLLLRLLLRRLRLELTLLLLRLRGLRYLQRRLRKSEQEPRDGFKHFPGAQPWGQRLQSLTYKLDV
jgi:hypothetical protein